MFFQRNMVSLLFIMFNIKYLLIRTGKRFIQLSDNENNNKKTIVKKTVRSGVSFGSALAMVISYNAWHSIGWAIVHGLLSWVYVIYYILRY